MVKKLSFALLCALVFVTSIRAQGPPETPKRNVTDTFFGKAIDDPYRWLEKVRDPEVLKWLGDQNSYTRSVLDAIPARANMLERMRRLDAETPPPLTSFARDDKGRIYFYRTGPNGIAKGYVRDPKTGAERVLIDPEKLAAAGGPPARVSAISPSPDGNYVAFLIRGLGRTKVQIIDTASGEFVGKPVENALGFTGLDWDPDSKSIYLVKLPPLRPDMKPAEAYVDSASYRHVVGTDPATDQPILVQGQNRGLNLRSTSWPFVFPTPDGKFLAVWIEDGARSGHALYVAPRKDIIESEGTWKKIADFVDGATGIVFHDSTAFLTVPRKSDGASHIVRVDVATETFASGKVVQMPNANSTIHDAQAASDALYVSANEGTAGVLYRIGYGGKAETIKPPVEGSIRLVMVTPTHAGGLIGVTAWTRPAAMYEFDPKRRWRESLLNPSRTVKGLELNVESVKVRSHDGIEVPLTLIYRKGLVRNGLNPTYMLGYGSYGTTADPSFDNMYVPWYEAGGILAFAHVRGGGELGEAWHVAGSKEKKKNTWLDFIACAEYLIENKYTSSSRLAGGGVSAGGILIGRSITEKPDLFGAATISVATTDMLRAEYQLNGPANVVEFGTTKEKDGFEQLYEMSAYHHVRDGVRYPAVLISTGMRDTNVDVWQPAKMAARMQAAAAGGWPVLLRVDPNAGHDLYGSTRPQMHELRADQLVFLMWQFGLLEKTK